MGLNYQAVGWNRQKRVYDLTLVLGVAVFLVTFIAIGAATKPNATPESLMIRAFGTGAFVLLHVILSVGPLCRLNPRFLPLLYNRRHMGVTMFVLGLAHGVLTMLQYHMFSDVNPLVSLFTSNSQYGRLADFPFQPLGFLALVILFLMAATSHDFWLHNLTAPVWKALHMMVYVAYGLLVMHVSLGVLQAERNPVYVGLVGLGFAWVLGVHWVAARREAPTDEPLDDAKDGDDGFLDVCAVDDIPENRARIACIAGDRVAIFRYDGNIAAVSNTCQHQNGPLGEGRVIDGCITCPWHGYQYDPASGESPPPFTEKVPTFEVRLRGDRVLVNPDPRRLGSPATPARVDGPQRGKS